MDEKIKILFLGAHCDDIELGCGATINKYFEKKYKLISFTFSKISKFKKNKIDLSENSKNALKELGIKNPKYFNFETNSFYKERQKIWEYMNVIDEKYKPNIVFTLEPDNQQDHETIFKETIRNFRRSSIICYKPSSRNAPNQNFNFYEKISKKNINNKIKALKNYHPLYENLFYFKEKNIKSIARSNGIYIESKFAEAFTIYKFLNS